MRGSSLLFATLEPVGAQRAAQTTHSRGTTCSPLRDRRGSGDVFSGGGLGAGGERAVEGDPSDDGFLMTSGLKNASKCRDGIAQDCCASNAEVCAPLIAELAPCC